MTTTITPSPSPVNAGAGLTFTVAYRNNGPSSATALGRTLSLPAGLGAANVVVRDAANAVISNAYNNTNGTITLPAFGTLTSGATTADVTVSITAVPASFASVAATSGVSTSSSQGTDAAANSAISTVPVTPIADVTTTITPSPSPVNAGQALTFTVGFGNSGPSTAAGVTRKVQLPVNLGTVNVSTATGTGTYTNSSGLVTFTPTPTTLASGANLDATIVIMNVPASLASVAATSTITTSTNQGAGMGADSFTSTIPVTPIADVTTTLAGPTLLATGQPSGNYTVTFKNNGPSLAEGVTRTVTLPAGVSSVVAPGGVVSGSTITYAPSGGTMTSGQNDPFTFSFTAPSATGTGLQLTSNIATTTSQGSAGAPDAANLTLTVTPGLNGYVFEDPNYGGGSGRPRSASGTTGLPGAKVELYDASGNYVRTTTTDANGLYIFPATDGSYTVRVVNSTVTSARPGAVASLLPVQTYNGATDRVGGEDPTKTDAAANTTATLSALTTATATATAQSIATVSVSGGTATGPDFGFNFSTIVNKNDTGQGSLRQFLVNSNALTNAGLDQVASSNGGPDPAAGTETSIFMISDGGPHAGLRSGLPNQLSGASGAARAVITLASGVAITDAKTALDGTSQTLNVGDTNTGTVGDNEAVGTDGLSLTAVSSPEVEIAGANVATVLSVTGGSATVRQVAVRGGSAQTIGFGTGSAGFLVDAALVGTSAISYDWAGDNTVSANFGINVSGAGVTGTVQGSTVAFTGNSGISINNGTATAGTLTIQGSGFNQNGYTSPGGDGISLGDGGGSGPVLIERNLFTRPNSSAIQFEIGQTAASIVRNNTIVSAGKGGAGTALNQLEGSAICYLQRDGNRRGAQSDLITKNIIVDTQASGIVVGYGQRNVTISQNAIFNSGSVAIDLVTGANAFVNGPNGGNISYGSGDGVTINDGNDPATAPATAPNRGADFPVLASLDIVSGSLVVEGFSRPGALLEFYIPSLDPTRFGEGQTYLASRTDNSGEDGLPGATGSYGPAAVNGLLQGQDAAASRFRFTLPFSALTTQQQNDIRDLGLTATATLNGSTSEFSGNVPFAADVVATVEAPVTIVAANASASFKVSFGNVGASAANGVTATVQLPANLNVTSVTGGGSYASASGLVTYPGITSILRAQTFSSVITYTQPLSGASVTAAAAVITTTSQNGLTANDAQSATIQTSPQDFDLYTTLAGPASVGAGQPVTYAVTTQNVGIGTAPDAAQTVSLPTAAALTNVFVSNGGSYSFGGGTSTFTFVVPASLGAGQQVNNTFSFVAPSISTPAGNPLNTLSFTAFVTPSALADGDQVATNNQATLTTTLTPAPSTEANVYTTIGSNATNGCVAPGAAITYTAVQGNNGPKEATNVATCVLLNPNMTAAGFSVDGVAGAQPGGAGTPVSFALPGGPATYSPATGMLALPVLATQTSGASTTCTVVAPAPASGRVTATSSVTAATADIVPADNSATTQVTVSNALTADLSVSIVGPAAATASQTLVYSITTTNNGAGQAQNVVTSVAIPAGLSLTAVRVNGNTATSTAGQTATFGTGPGAITYNTGTGLVNIPIVSGLADAGTSVVHTVSYAAPVSDNNLVNVATVRATSPDNVPANNTAQVTTTVQPQADVQVLISGPATSVVGAPVTLVVTSTNLGPSSVPTQSLTVQLPSTLNSRGGVEVRDNAGNLLPGTAYNNITGIVTLPTITNQSSGATAAVRATISFNSPAGSVFSPSAGASVPGTLDPNLGNNEASISVSVAPATPTPRPDLSTGFTAATSTSATAGQAITLAVQTVNAAGVPTAKGIFQDVLLSSGLGTAGFTVNGAAGVLNATTGLIEFAVSAGTATYTPGTGFLSVPINNLASGVSTTTTVVLPAPGISSLAVTAAVHGDQSDAVTANNRATVVITITPTVDVTTTVAGPASAPIGSTVTYSVVTTNAAVSDATNVVQTVTLPTGASDVVISGGGTQSGNTVTFPTIAVLPPGANGLTTNSISFTVPNTTPSITVTGSVTATGDNAAGGNNTASQLTTTQPNRPPVAADVVNTLTAPDGNTAVEKLPISGLLATDADGNSTVATYTLISVPDPAAVGTLYLGNTAIAAPRTLTATEAGQLSFLPKTGFVGNAFFTYTATDNAPLALASNLARYTLPVGQDNNSFYVATAPKGGTDHYANDDVLAFAIDPNGARYNSGGIYTTSDRTINGVAVKAGSPVGATVASGLRTSANTVNASLDAAGTGPAGNTANELPTGVRLNTVTGQIYVSDITRLPHIQVATTYSAYIITTDVYGGVSRALATFTIGGYPLPVELTAFTAVAAGPDAQLAWTTASEKNNDHFAVERSLDGATYSAIGRVAGQGTKTSPTDYHLTDKGIGAKASGNVYYRLQQVDADGTSTYSPVRVLTFTAAPAPVALSLYPNPTTTESTLSLTGLPAGVYQVSILDATGRLVRQLALNGPTHTLDLHDLAQGTYQLRVQGTAANGAPFNLGRRLVKE